MATLSKNFGNVVLDNNILRVDGTSLIDGQDHTDDPVSAIYVILTWDGAKTPHVASPALPSHESWEVQFPHEDELEELGNGDVVHLVGLAIYPESLGIDPFVWDETKPIGLK